MGIFKEVRKHYFVKYFMFSKPALVSKTEIIFKQNLIYVDHIEYRIHCNLLASQLDVIWIILNPFKLNEIGIKQ